MAGSASGEAAHWFRAKRVGAMQGALRAWFDAHGRDFPWRRRRSPYRVWVSEIMLQQTQTAAVVPYFRRFLRRFPSARRLAAARIDDVLAAWEGLGYYRRARQLHEAARILQEHHRGRFPRTLEEWTALPGIGPYTARAILSFAFGQRHAVLEANTRRLYARLLGTTDDPSRPRTTRALWAFAEKLLPESDIAEWNDALMDLGSTVCLPAEPRCGGCPWAPHCLALRNGTQAVSGRPQRRPRITHVVEDALLLRDGARLLLRQRGPDERWSGLWDVIRLGEDAAAGSAAGAGCSEAVDGEAVGEEAVGAAARSDGGPGIDAARRCAEALGCRVRRAVPGTQLRYHVTRYQVTLRAVCLEVQRVADPDSSHRWVTIEELERLPLTRPARRLVEWVVGKSCWREVLAGVAQVEQSDCGGDRRVGRGASHRAARG